MQATLLHSEQILAQAQPAYVSQLRVSAAVARGITDSSILKLSVVAIGVLPMQFVSGLSCPYPLCPPPLLLIFPP